MNVYIIRDKVSKTYAGTPFLCESDDAAIRVFHFSAEKSPFRRDLSLYSLGQLTDYGVGNYTSPGNVTAFYPQCEFVSDFSEAYLRQYEEVNNDNEE